MSSAALSFHTTQMNRCIDGLRAGDRAAADELVRRAQDRFRRLGQRMYRSFPNVKPVADADDVIQVGWIRLLRSLQKLRPTNTCTFFLLASVEIRRELLDLARKARTAKYQAHSLQGSAAGGSQPTEPSDRSAADIDLWEQFHLAVGDLRSDLRETMSLIFYNGRTQAEVADLLGRDVRTIGRWWRQACIELRARVRGWTPPPN